MELGRRVRRRNPRGVLTTPQKYGKRVVSSPVVGRVRRSDLTVFFFWSRKRERTVRGNETIPRVYKRNSLVVATSGGWRIHDGDYPAVFR